MSNFNPFMMSPEELKRLDERLYRLRHQAQNPDLYETVPTGQYKVDVTFGYDGKCATHTVDHMKRDVVLYPDSDRLEITDADGGFHVYLNFHNYSITPITETRLIQPEDQPTTIS